jgi:hypothetical protein
MSENGKLEGKCIPKEFVEASRNLGIMGPSAHPGIPGTLAYTTSDKINMVTVAIRKLLQEKNKRYGDSALNPLGAFSKLSAEDAIRIRLDDKLKRVMNSDELRKNDVADIIGYLVLLSVAKDWLNFDELID